MEHRIAEWVYKATTARRDFDDTRELAVNLGFIARSAFGKTHKRVSNVRRVSPGDFIHFYFRRPDRSEPDLLGSFRVQDGAKDTHRFEPLPKEGALVCVRRVPENKALLDLLYRVPLHKGGEAYVDDPKLERMTGWLVQAVETFGPVYDKTLFPGRGTLYPISQDPPPATRPRATTVGAVTAGRRAILLHLSDLHFGTLADAERWHGQLAADLKLEQSISKLDAMIVSGDIGNRADADEYTAARRFLQGVMSEFGLSPQRIVLVPGNHDLSWTLSEKAYIPERRRSYKGTLEPGTYIDGGEYIELRSEAHYRDRFRPFAEFYESVRMEPYSLDYSEQAMVQHLPEQRLVILGLNSAWNLDHHFRDRAEIHSEALARALTAIRNTPAYSGCLKLAVWHHPVSGAGEDRIRDTGFLEQLVQAGFLFGLHGHQHKAANELFRYDHGRRGRTLELLSAGTFGAPTREWTSGIPLQYQVLELSDRKLIVHTRRREEPNGAWKPDARWQKGRGRDPKPRYEIDLGPT